MSDKVGMASRTVSGIRLKDVLKWKLNIWDDFLKQSTMLAKAGEQHCLPLLTRHALQVHRSIKEGKIATFCNFSEGV